MKSPPEQSSADQPAARRPRKLTWWRRFLLAVVTPFLALVLKSIWALYRFEFRDEGFRDWIEDGQPVVLAIWHEGLLVVTKLIHHLLRRRIKVTFLISPSVDGEVGVRLLAFFGSIAVRGSARRSGAAALRKLKHAVSEEGRSPCITLDGSKGPRRHAKPGALMVARMAGVPIVPIGFAAEKSWRARTWDRHLIPRPFSRVVITVGEPYTVPRKMDERELEAHRQELENRVNHVMQESEECLEMAAPTRAAPPSGE
jgi:lysophospholipid acyltransferase (LPLAT)-like uncharacterized protein